MGYYSTIPLDNRSMSSMAAAECYGYGTGESHARIIQSAGGEIGRDGFMDPRPGHSGEMVADRVFINQKTNTVQGINFSKNGEFCCSYTGMNYDDIKDTNKLDCEQKRAMERNSAEATESKTLQRQRSEAATNTPNANGMGEGNGFSQSHKKGPKH